MFKSNLHVARDMTTRHVWVVTKPLVWEDGRFYVTVPVGFEFDFASIPKFAQAWLPKAGMLYDRASCLHDYLYVTELFSRKECDKLFYKAMLSDGVPKSRAWIMYQAVRLGGRIPWRQHTLSTINEARQLGGYPLLEKKNE